MKSFIMLLGVVASITAHAAYADEHDMSSHALTLRHPMEADFVAIPNAADCNTMASLRGDLGKEAATFVSKMTPGCVAPWHWHTPTEEIVILQGTAEMQMNDANSKPMVLPVGSYSQLPSRNLHRFRCLQGADCVILVISDGPFDIHWVDNDRNEITFEEALELEKADGGDW